MTGNWGDQEQEYQQRIRAANRISIPALRGAAVRGWTTIEEPTMLALVEAVEAAQVLNAHYAGSSDAEFWPFLQLADALARFDFGGET